MALLKLTPTVLRGFMLLVTLLALSPILQSQQPKSLEWRVEQQPTAVPCGPDDLAFASAPEQIALEKSYNVPELPGWNCESITAPTFNGARVLRIMKPSVIDDGQAYTLVQPRGASSARLIPFSEGHLLWGNEDDRHNRAAMNAMLQTSNAGHVEDADWLAISLAYLTVLGEEPTLTDRHYAPGPNQHFKSYTVPGLLREVPAFRSKHLLPTAKCQQSACEVRFYYRTEPVDSLKTATFEYILQSGKIFLASVRVVDYVGPTRKKKTLCE